MADRKEARKGEIIAAGRADLADYRDQFKDRPCFQYMGEISADFGAAIKGLKTFKSMEDSVAVAATNAKMAANDLANRIDSNLRHLQSEHADRMALFPDLAALVGKQADDFKNLVSARVLASEAAEKKRAEEAAERERERIRREEAARVEREAQQRREQEARQLREQQESEARERRQREEAAAPAPGPAPAVPAPQPQPSTPSPAVAAHDPVLVLGERAPVSAPNKVGDSPAQEGLAMSGTGAIGRTANRQRSVLDRIHSLIDQMDTEELVALEQHLLAIVVG